MTEKKMGEKDRFRNSPQVIFILGGARSGKSRYAQKIAKAFKGKKLFVATAQALDEEMAGRIENHKKQRGGMWETREEPIEIVQVVSEMQSNYGVILIDCLTLWVSNLLMAFEDDRERVENCIKGLIDRLTNIKTTVILVSNEVGSGIVPENRLARSFRDLAGLLNQGVAQVADRVVLMVAGIPVVVKGEA